MATTKSEKLRKEIDEELEEERAILGHCQIKDKEMLYLSEALKNNQIVETLNLDNNQIGSEGMRFLSEALRFNKTVKVLNLDNNQIDSKGMLYLCEALQVTQTVETLSLGDNQIGNKGLGFLSASIAPTVRQMAMRHSKSTKLSRRCGSATIR